MAMSVRLPAWL